MVAVENEGRRAAAGKVFSASGTDGSEKEHDGYSTEAGKFAVDTGEPMGVL
jgi:hypothetical protein